MKNFIYFQYIISKCLNYYKYFTLFYRTNNIFYILILEVDTKLILEILIIFKVVIFIFEI